MKKTFTTSLSLGIDCSTLDKWIIKARNQEFEAVSPDEVNIPMALEI
ncbi:MAG: hypothetical protein GXP14_14060 [Gammaproteobacteria bacterium]|nr:hypothetical protein [Gammaproteobacteria bacterium]